MSNIDQSYIIPVTNTTKRIELNLVYTNFNGSVQRLHIIYCSLILMFAFKHNKKTDRVCSAIGLYLMQSSLASTCKFVK